MESKVPFTLKDTITVVASIAILIGLYKLFQLLGVVSTDDERKQEKTIKKDIKKLEKEGESYSYSKTTYDGFAETIYQENQSMNTDEEKIYEIFRKMNNELDVVALKDAFGKRRPQFDTQARDLDGFLNADLNKEEIGEINSILQRKKIKYRF
jgi:phospholipase/lecithinase/hemolysin